METTVPGRLYAAIADLPFLIHEHDFQVLKQAVSSGFERVTTVVRLRGGGREGVGEDVTYEAEAHERVLPERSAFPLAGRHTIDGFSALLEGLLPVATDPHARWGFESAALDLALRQADTTLGEVLARIHRSPSENPVPPAQKGIIGVRGSRVATCCGRERQDQDRRRPPGSDPSRVTAPPGQAKAGPAFPVVMLQGVSWGVRRGAAENADEKAPKETPPARARP